MTVVYVWVMILVGNPVGPFVMGMDTPVHFTTEAACRKFIPATTANLGFQGVNKTVVVDCVQTPIQVMALPKTKD